MIYNPQRIQDDLVQDTVILTRLLTPRISLENLASVIKRRRLRRVFAGSEAEVDCCFLTYPDPYMAPKTAVFECLAICEVFIPTVCIREKSPLPAKKQSKEKLHQLPASPKENVTQTWQHSKRFFMAFLCL